jgi:hypothetical protein
VDHRKGSQAHTEDHDALPLLDQKRMLLASPANCHIGEALLRHARDTPKPEGVMPQFLA